MRRKLAVALISALASVQVFAAPAAVATCTRVVYVIVADPPGSFERREVVPCAVSRQNSIGFDDGANGPGGNGTGGAPDSWVGRLPSNETGAAYLSTSELASDYRSLSRNVKPYIGATAYFGTLFAESLGSYQNAAIGRNESVDVNLGRVRGAATSTQADLAQSRDARYSGLPAVSAQQATRLSQNLATNKKGVDLAQGAVASIRDRLAMLPQTTPPADLGALAGRNKLPQEIAREVAKVVDPRKIVGSVTLIGTSQVGTGLANAVDLELAQYDRLDPAIRTSSSAIQGAEALKQARFYASRSPGVAQALYAEGRSTRAFLLGESKVDEVAVWDAATNQIVFAPRVDAVNRVLAYARLFGDQSNSIRGKISAAAGGSTQRPPDSLLRTTERLVSRAEEELDSDPVKSLGGLFRARTLVENAKLYGGAWVKLTLWTTGAAKRLREAFTPPPSLKEPGGFGKYVAIEISKKLKDSLSSYRKGVEAGEYAMLGIDKVQDIFGSDALTEMKVSLRDAEVAAASEAKPLSALDGIAPTVELWVSPEARVANESNTKAEIAELTNLRDLYSARSGVLKDYQQRLNALSALSNLYAYELSSPVWVTVASMKCLTTACAAEVIALSDQLSEVGSISQDTSREVQKTIERYESEMKKIDQLLDAWLLVLPGSAVKGYRSFGAPTRELIKQFP